MRVALELALLFLMLPQNILYLRVGREERRSGRYARLGVHHNRNLVRGQERQVLSEVDDILRRRFSVVRVAAQNLLRRLPAHIRLFGGSSHR